MQQDLTNCTACSFYALWKHNTDGLNPVSVDTRWVDAPASTEQLHYIRWSCKARADTHGWVKQKMQHTEVMKKR